MASVAALAVFAAGPVSAGPIASVSVRTPIGGAPVGPAGFTVGAPAMTFSPMGASLSAPTLSGGALPGLQTLSTPDSVTPTARPDFASAPIPLPTTVPNANARIPSMPPSALPTTGAALSGRVTGRGAVLGTLPIDAAVKTAEGLPRDMDSSLSTVRGKRNQLGLRFAQLRRAFGMRADEGSFSPEGAAAGSLNGRDAGAVRVSLSAESSAEAAPSAFRNAGASFGSGGAFARALARLAELVGPAPASGRARAPRALTVNFSGDRLGVWIFGEADSYGANGAGPVLETPGAARDRVLRVAVPAPGTLSLIRSPAAAKRAPMNLSAAGTGFSIVGVGLSFARDGVVRSFSDDGPVRRWLRAAVSRLNAGAVSASSAGFSRLSRRFFPRASGRLVPDPLWASQSASGWSAWLASLIVPLVALYYYFSDAWTPGLASVPVSSRPRA